MNETLAYEPDVKNPKNPKLVQDPDYIQFDEVSFSYPSSAEENLKKGFFYIKTRRNARGCRKNRKRKNDACTSASSSISAWRRGYCSF